MGLQEISEERKKALKQEDLKILLDNYKNDSTGETSLALAQKYEEGEGIEKDEAKAVSFYQEAAKQGNAEAVYNLGRVAENGIDMDGDIAQALQLYELAGKLGYSPAFEALDQLQEQLATCCAEIISRTSGEQINFSIEKLEIKKAIAVCKHLALKSFSMAMLYYGYITMHDGQGDFSKKYRNSSDPLELTLAFLEVLEQTENNDDAWYFLEKLFSKNVYCAFLNFIVAIMVMLKESDDKEFVIKMYDYLSLFCGVCALGGCLEAQGLCIHLEIDIDDPVFRKRVEKEWETQRSEVIAKLKNVLKVHPTISVKQWILVNFPTISSKIFQ